MTTRESLLAAVSRHPFDDLARNAALDWALENGDVLLAATLSEPDPVGSRSRYGYDGGDDGDGGDGGGGYDGGDGGGYGYGGGYGGYGGYGYGDFRLFGTVRWGTKLRSIPFPEG